MLKNDVIKNVTSVERKPFALSCVSRLMATYGIIKKSMMQRDLKIKPLRSRRPENSFLSIFNLAPRYIRLARSRTLFKRLFVMPFVPFSYRIFL